MRVETARNVQPYYTPFARFCLSGNMKSILNNSAAVPLPDRFAHGGQCPLTHRFAHATRLFSAWGRFESGRSCALKSSLYSPT